MGVGGTFKVQLPEVPGVPLAKRHVNGGDAALVSPGAHHFEAVPLLQLLVATAPGMATSRTCGG